jgi:hypothetical protein
VFILKQTDEDFGIPIDKEYRLLNCILKKYHDGTEGSIVPGLFSLFLLHPEKEKIELKHDVIGEDSFILFRRHNQYKINPLHEKVISKLYEYIPDGYTGQLTVSLENDLRIVFKPDFVDGDTVIEVKTYTVSIREIILQLLRYSTLDNIKSVVLLLALDEKADIFKYNDKFKDLTVYYNKQDENVINYLISLFRKYYILYKHKELLMEMMKYMYAFTIMKQISTNQIGTTKKEILDGYYERLSKIVLNDKKKNQYQEILKDLLDLQSIESSFRYREYFL